MWYGYDTEIKGYKPERETQLVTELAKEFKLPVGYFGGSTPYIEHEKGFCVRLRRITHLPEKEIEKMVKTADKIYKRVMG